VGHGEGGDVVFSSKFRDFVFAKSLSKSFMFVDKSFQKRNLTKVFRKKIFF
jgi:hypothetical protein